MGVIGAGWAGMAAAVQAVLEGHRVHVFEATATLGGRARELPCTLPDGQTALLDNGQHILIGGYSQTLAMLQTVGVHLQAAFLRIPMDLRDSRGVGLALPKTKSPWNVIAGILTAKGWSFSDKKSFTFEAHQWQRRGFMCDAGKSVKNLCANLSPTVMATLIEPLCLSALNTPPERACAQVFLRVLGDALFNGQLFGDGRSSDLMLPLTDLSSLFPNAAATWLSKRGHSVHTKHRIETVAWDHGQWKLTIRGQEPQLLDAVICATNAPQAGRLLEHSLALAPPNVGTYFKRWIQSSKLLHDEAITTVYAHASGVRLPRPMVRLASSHFAPAQFVFDRGQLAGPAGLLAFVVSASYGDKETIQNRVLAQAAVQLSDYLQGEPLRVVQTVVEKRATFACQPAMRRPATTIAPGLLACGDYTYAPYPSTLEGAVRSGILSAIGLADLGGFHWKE